MANHKFLIFGVFVFCWSSFAAQEAVPQKQYESVFGNRKPTTASEKKVQKIEAIIYSYFNKGNDINNSQVKSEIITEIKALYPFNSGKTPLNANVPQFTKEAELKANKKLPLSGKELNAKYSKEAEDIYKPIPMESVVTLTYKQGPYTKTITGRYFGLTYYKDGVKLENNVIPIIDLSDADKGKFDSSVRELNIKKYIGLKTADYAEQKKNFIDSAVKEKIEEIVASNEKDGFIFIWNKWLTPEEVVNVLITHVEDTSNRKPLEPVFEAEKRISTSPADSETR